MISLLAESFTVKHSETVQKCQHIHLEKKLLTLLYFSLIYVKNEFVFDAKVHSD